MEGVRFSLFKAIDVNNIDPKNKNVKKRIFIKK